MNVSIYDLAVARNFKDKIHSPNIILNITESWRIQNT